jgi:Rrf2 family protein
MKISTRGRYSLEALLYLALNTAPATFLSIRDIAGNTGVTEGYLEQLFIPLKKSGLVQSTRGAQGGYQLGKAARNISIGDILHAVEGSLEPV